MQKMPSYYVVRCHKYGQPFDDIYMTQIQLPINFGIASDYRKCIKMLLLAA